MNRRRIWILITALAAAAAALVLLLWKPVSGPAAGSGAALWIDGREAEAEAAAAPAPGGAQVVITLDGKEIAQLPFGEEHEIRIRQEDGENIIRMTRDAVRMEAADCPGGDCLQMGEVTLENLETRVMGGFIICLPHRLSVEVRD